MAAPNFLVGIRGSSGALESCQTLFGNLTNQTGMAFVVVTHLSPHLPTHLVEILSRATKMPVQAAFSGLAIEGNNVYVVTPNTDLAVVDGYFSVSSPRTIEGGKHKQVDVFLTSLSRAFGKQAIAIILSGGDGDGTEGCAEIQNKGGQTFAQDPSDAPVSSMPLHALRAGTIDFVLSSREIANRLTAIASMALPN